MQKSRQSVLTDLQETTPRRHAGIHRTALYCVEVITELLGYIEVHLYCPFMRHEYNCMCLLIISHSFFIINLGLQVGNQSCLAMTICR